MNFSNLNISENILKVLKEREINQPTEIQQKAIPLLKENKDLIGLSQTGTGKTLAFAIPLIEKIDINDEFVQAIILCPTRELCQQLLGEIKILSKYVKGIKAVALYGGADITNQIYNLKRRANIIVGTPGRVLDHIKRHTLKLGGVSTLILDEADEMLNMGFRNDIETIIKKTPIERQTVMFSATMNNEIMQLAKNFLNSPVELKIGQINQTLSNIEQTYFVVPKDKKKRALHSLLQEIEKGTTIIFCNTKAMVGGVQSYLEKQGYPLAVIHGDMPQSQRSRIMKSYKNGEIDILVTTDVSARGIDVNDILNVINYDLPQNLEWYIHRIGRTGRAGKKGYAWTILNSQEQAKKLKEIERKTNSIIKLSKLNLDGVTTIKENNNFKKRGKKLNTKKREIRNPNNNLDKYLIKTKKGNKLGIRTKTLRNVHKSKIKAQTTKQKKANELKEVRNSNKKNDIIFSKKVLKQKNKK